MNETKKSLLADILINIVTIVYALYIVWIGLNILVYIGVLTNPGRAGSKFFSITTMFELSPSDLARNFSVTSSDPAAAVDMKLLGYFKMRTGNRGFNSLIMLGFLLWQGLYLVVINQLRKILFSIRAGNPFVNKNIRRIRLLGDCLIGAELVRILGGFLYITFFKGTLSVPGTRLDYLDFPFYWEWLNLEIIFAGILILLIAEVFRVGIKLREEQELTI